MLMNEIRKKSKLSRKVIEYYEAKGLINPKRDSSNYRIYSEEDLIRLNKIAIYRKLECSIDEIKEILSDKEKIKLSYIIRTREIKNELDNKKTKILKSLLIGKNAVDLKKELKIIETQETMFAKLCEAFPGYLGQAFFASYKPFLNEQLNLENQKYFNDYIEFLDNLPDLPLSDEEKELIERSAKNTSFNLLKNINDAKLKALDDDGWLKENKELIEQYMAYKQSEEYRRSPIAIIQEKIKKYLEQNGYYDIAIPLMRRFSPSYDEYYKKMLMANDRLISDMKL